MPRIARRIDPGNFVIVVSFLFNNYRFIFRFLGRLGMSGIYQTPIGLPEYLVHFGISDVRAAPILESF